MRATAGNEDPGVTTEEGFLERIVSHEGWVCRALGSIESLLRSHGSPGAASGGFQGQGASIPLLQPLSSSAVREAGLRGQVSVQYFCLLLTSP